MTVNLRALIGKLNDTARTVLEGAAGLCLSQSHYDIEIEHLLVKLLDAEANDFKLIGRHFGIDQNRLANELHRSMDRLKTGNPRSPAFSPYTIDAFVKGWLYGSIEHDARKIRTGFVIVALLAEDDLKKLVNEFSREMQKINVDVLRRDFDVIVRGSIEEELIATPAEPPTSPEPRGGPRVFISYRRDDSAIYADYLFASLRADVPDLRVFRDSDTLRPGMVYPDKIKETLAACDILLAIIGKKWLGATNTGGKKRIHSADDWVRLEIAAALQYDKLVIPCLVGGARMPTQDELPQELAGLTLRQSITISKTDLKRDTEELVQRLREWQRR